MAQRIGQMKIISLEHVRRLRKGDRKRTDRAAKDAVIAMRRLVSAVRYAPIRKEHREMLQSIWAEYGCAIKNKP